ncbi:MAG: EAL domain-containing protein, partial [Acidimicrobiales bacterium]
GTGYSSLSYLNRFPYLSSLKIDRSFVQTVIGGRQDGIISAIIALGQTLGMSVVGEGVETPDQLDRLRRLGCDQAQGYHFAYPMPPDEVTALLSATQAGDHGG